MSAALTELAAGGLTLDELASRLADHHTDPVVRAFAERVINARLSETVDETDDD